MKTDSGGGTDSVPSGEVIYWDGLQGGHNDLGWAEGTLDLIRRVASLP
jgi:hypothetical protein